MPTYRAVLTRFLLRYFVGRKYRRAGESIRALRELDDLMIRNQRPPRGTQVSHVDLDGLSGDWVQGPGAAADAVILHLHGGAFVTGSPEAYRELAARIALHRSTPFPPPSKTQSRRIGGSWTRGTPPPALSLAGSRQGGGWSFKPSCP